ncbi:MAG: aminoacyl-histidine dipeptidase [Bacteroidetes bacterium]|nr:aminoacyl-histidine dipeptidase [Bacteroidota bacterium]
MNTFNGLKPEAIWNYFEEICQVARPSKKEEKMIQFLLEFGKKNNLETKRDEAGNVLIKKPATRGKENLKPIILQSHIDMVCEKNSDVVFDFEKDAIQPFIDGDWVKAKGTTLGADDGIGIAAEMAILTANNIEHGPIECLFTVDEETGLSGAFALKKGFFDSKILLNLDSEDEGELFIGCAGGIDTVAYFQYNTQKVPADHCAVKIQVSGLKGGHSGDDIEKGLGNSNKILNRFIWNSTYKFNAKISTIDGGNLRNAIAREAYAILTLPKENKDKFTEYVRYFEKDVKFELSHTEPGLKFSYEEVSLPSFLIDDATQKNLINAVYACPHGVIAMSRSMPGLVETSSNLASIKFKDDKIIVTTSQRSSVNSSKRDIANMVESVFLLAGAAVEHSEGYPGWTPNTNSEILNIAKISYKKLFGIEPNVRAIHAGLECGLFLEKYPDLDMVSFGPTLRGVHSPDEKINIPSVQKFWDLLLEILNNIPIK